MVQKVDGASLPGFGVEEGNVNFRESWGRKSKLFTLNKDV
jgi:hypothetical protein